ncbi:TatD family hydrolase [Candidatus Uhrbacteria bacterium]|nr:TatD family hydrolase [Candidatus Uhrbacteria bacterium]
MEDFPKLIDTHAHLTHSVFADDWRAVVNRALEQNIWMIVVGTDYASSVEAISFAEAFPRGVYAAVGFHPQGFSSEEKQGLMTVDQFVDFESFGDLLRHPKVVAIGEVGLDFHHLSEGHLSDPEHRSFIIQLQYEALDHFLEFSRQFRLPLILHARDAYPEMIQRLRRFDRTSRGFDSRGIIHHFTGHWPEAKSFLNLDFYLSFTGAIVRSRSRDEVIQKTPISKLVVMSSMGVSRSA